ncbi:NmrA family transcriptional regulator [Mollisia scopiformis]|uniref:NmrA family transcriptional regulator n=1 Tax=Mollisia scopiformis TaxID=149040 RepID=A0A194XJ09_MOLSC|nr:NmrA family transcriptional regulator [Mollisia scopiformis]KUJ20143.1 NmrA family transcriptional regulator [Mollisia scopiformis]
MSKLLTVFGATGMQGGSLIHHILNRPELSKLFQLRGITRDASKQAAVSLRERGVEIVQADLSDPVSLEPAVAGSYAVFAVTNYWDNGSCSAAIEIAQGKAVADAAVQAGVALLIWSSLPNITEITNGAVTTIHHFDSKAEVETYIRGLPITAAFFMAGWYMQNHKFLMPPKKNDDGTVVFSQTWSPTTVVPMIDITDTGKFVTPILLNPDKYNGKSFTCATAFYTPIQLVDGWTTVTGRTVTYEQIGSDKKQGNLTAEMQKQLKDSTEGINTWSYFGPNGEKDLEWTLAQLEEKLTSWEEFLRNNEPWFPEA